MDRICYLVPNVSTYEGDPMWNRTIPAENRSRVNRVLIILQEAYWPVSSEVSRFMPFS